LSICGPPLGLAAGCLRRIDGGGAMPSGTISPASGGSIVQAFMEGADRPRIPLGRLVLDQTSALGLDL